MLKSTSPTVRRASREIIAVPDVAALKKLTTSRGAYGAKGDQCESLSQAPPPLTVHCRTALPIENWLWTYCRSNEIELLVFAGLGKTRLLDPLIVLSIFSENILPDAVPVDISSVPNSPESGTVPEDVVIE